MFSIYQALFLAAASAGKFNGGVTLAGLPDEINDFNLRPNKSYAGVAFHTNGNLDTVRSNVRGEETHEVVGDWLASGVSSDYAIRVTKVGSSDNLTTGPMGVWTTVNDTQLYMYEVPGTSIGLKTGVFTIEIRRVSDSVVILSQSIILTANVEV
jgi:hypothetical protein